MRLLRDEDIVQLLETSRSILKNYDRPYDWYAADSLVQPSSIDLHIGKIILPPQDKPGSNDSLDYQDGYSLKPGETVVVVTKEEFQLPNDIAGFGFPPTSIADRAILMTNPGHIDPGFKGPLSFTLINMGRDSFAIAIGLKVVTVLLVKLGGDPKGPFEKRYPNYDPNPTLKNLYKLGRDFLDLDNRSRNVARKVVEDEDIRIRSRQVWAPIIAVLITAAVTLGASWVQNGRTIADLNQKIIQLQSQFDVDKRLDDLEKKMDKLSSTNLITTTNNITKTNTRP